MYPDLKELLSILNDNKVQYLVVGGYAVSFHAQPRATGDLDILIKPDAENAAAGYAAQAAGRLAQDVENLPRARRGRRFNLVPCRAIAEAQAVIRSHGDGTFVG